MTKWVFALFGFLLASQVHAAGSLSTYTSIGDKTCIIHDASSLHKHPEIDFLKQECAGLGGYQVFVAGGDLRYPLHLVYNGQFIRLTSIGAFHQTGSKNIEWVYTREKDTVTYKALIHRINYEDDGDPKTPDATILIVTKLDKEKTCPVAVVRASKNMNQQARAIAAKADGMLCIDPENLL